MRNSVMEPLVPAAAAAHTRKRPRQDEDVAPTLPPRFFHHHQQQHYQPQSQHYTHHHHQHPYTHAEATQPQHRPMMLPTLSQVLNPSVHLGGVHVPPLHHSPARIVEETRNASPYNAAYAHSHTMMSATPMQLHAVAAAPRDRPFSSPSPPASEASVAEDEDESAEDKTPWPTANEYLDILTDPARQAHIPVYDLGVDPRGVPLQPEFIYNEPRSCMYFLKCGRLLGRGSFGFPRKKKAAAPAKASKGDVDAARRDASKEFEWRKMSFVTGLPKKKPIVRYITATCYSKVHRNTTEKKKVLRMHAVMLASDDGAGECGDYVLVHIRSGGSKRVGVRTATPPPAASPPRHVPEAAPASIRSLLSAHHDMLASERPVTPLVYGVSTSHAGVRTSTPPMSDKCRRTGVQPPCPRQMPLWLSPPSHEHGSFL